MRKLPGPFRDPRLFRHGGAVTPDRAPLLDFSVSVNPLGPPASVLQALHRELPAIARYPDPESRRLTRCLAEFHRVDATQVIVANGSNELIYAIARAFAGRRVAIVEPTFTEYLRATLTVQGTVDHWLAEGPSFQPQAFDPEGACLVWLGNPNNPTGRRWSRDDLVSWIAAFPAVGFVVDEAFLPFLSDEAAQSVIPVLDRLPNVIVLRSLTKVYTLPGLRLGYAVLSPRQAESLRWRLAPAPWSVNCLAQAAGLAALQDGPFLARTRAWLTAERNGFLEQLAGLHTDLEPIPSEVNFLLLRLIRAGMTARRLTRRLEERGLAIRDASNFVVLEGRFIRVAVRTAPDNQRLLEELRRALADGG
jgi:threonine-phosphate decarboxylase